MDWTPTSLLSSSPRACPSTGDDTRVETIPAYPSPIHAEPSLSDSHHLCGLGISFCDTEIPFNQPNLHSTTETYSMPAIGWPDQMRFSEPFNGPTLDDSGFVPGVECGWYPDIAGIYNSPASLYGAQPMVLSSSYEGTLDAFASQPSEIWPGYISPPFSLSETKTMDAFQGPLSFADTQSTAGVPLLAQMPQPPAGNALFSLPSFDPDTGVEIYPNLGQDVSRRPDATVQNVPSKPITPSPRGKLSPNSSRKCEFCDFTFTRTSNCRDHMKKKHDPSCTKTHSCQICRRSFRRRPDLTRHVDCVGMPIFCDRSCANRPGSPQEEKICL